MSAYHIKTVQKKLKIFTNILFTALNINRKFKKLKFCISWCEFLIRSIQVAGEIRELTYLRMNRNKNQEIREHFLRKTRNCFLELFKTASKSEKKPKWIFFKLSIFSRITIFRVREGSWKGI
jgi:hypothetical protein